MIISLVNRQLPRQLRGENRAFRSLTSFPNLSTHLPIKRPATRGRKAHLAGNHPFHRFPFSAQETSHSRRAIRSRQAMHCAFELPRRLLKGKPASDLSPIPVVSMLLCGHAISVSTLLDFLSHRTVSRKLSCCAALCGVGGGH